MSELEKLALNGPEVIIPEGKEIEWVGIPRLITLRKGYTEKELNQEVSDLGRIIVGTNAYAIGQRVHLRSIEGEYTKTDVSVLYLKLKDKV